MNNLNYNAQDAATVAPKVEEKIREEFGGADPIQYEVETGDVSTANVRTVLGDIAAGLFGGKEKSLFRLVFQFTTPRPAQLMANVARMGIGSYVGILIYSAVLAKSVSGEAALEGPKMFGKSKFIGDPSTAARLNANGQLLKVAAELARLESPIAGGQTVKIERYCVVKPYESGSILIVHTLARPTKMGLNATVDAKSFFELVSLVESAL